LSLGASRSTPTFHKWDLGEFDQKGTVGTRWGTKEELLQATAIAKAHGIDIIIDAVLNVCGYLEPKIKISQVQHKMGADRSETFKAIPVDPQNRLVTIGPERQIEVCGFPLPPNFVDNFSSQGLLSISLEGAIKCVPLVIFHLLGVTSGTVQQPEMEL
jgi:hypothetical protein